MISCINCFVVLLSKGFSKFPVTRQIPFKKDDIFSDSSFRKSSSDFVGMIIEVEGTGPELIEINIGPIFREFSEIESIMPFSKFSIFTRKVRFSYAIVFVLQPESTTRLFQLCLYCYRFGLCFECFFD